MKNIKYISALLFALAVISVTTSGCLKVQKDATRSTTDTIDAHLYKDAWTYLKSRAYNNVTANDTIYRRMYDAIIYSGIDTNEYIKPNRTFILFTNTMITTKTTGLWATVLTSASKAATSWKSYPAADVKNYLSYLILTAQYSHYNLPEYDVAATTLAPAGVYTTQPANFKIPNFISNPTSVMNIKILGTSVPGSNTQDYPVTINATFYVTTCDLLATNGVVDVVSTSTPILPNIPQ
jgi:hypothetical protein